MQGRNEKLRVLAEARAKKRKQAKTKRSAGDTEDKPSTGFDVEDTDEEEDTGEVAIGYER